jgi:hypothetical protein
MVLFTIKGQEGGDARTTYNMTLISRRSDRESVPLVTDDYFSLSQHQDEAVVHVTKSISGPQSFELLVTASVLSADSGDPLMTLASKVSVHVSEYEF